MSEVDIDYVEEHGPGVVDLSQTPPEEQATAEAVVVEPLQLWEQETIETFLKGAGVGLHMLAGAAERDWLMTEKDLERIAPPLTRICNRYEPILRAAPYADPLLVAHGFVLYGWRSALERKRALRDLQELHGRGDGYERTDGSEGAIEESELDIDELLVEDGEIAFPESPRATRP